VTTHSARTPAPDPAIVLALMRDPGLAEGTDRIAAAAGVRLVRGKSPDRKVWSSAAAVVLDPECARQCVLAAMPRRDAVVLVAASDPSPSMWSAGKCE